MNDQNRNDVDGEELEKNDDKLIEKIGAILLRYELLTANSASDRDKLDQKAARILQRLEESHSIVEVEKTLHEESTQRFVLGAPDKNDDYRAMAEEIWEVLRDQRYAWVEASITFLPTSAGGRRTSVDLSGVAFYRPHIVIGNPAQREPIVRERNTSEEEYLAVQFRPCNKVIAPGQTTIVKLELIFYHADEYDKLTGNTDFTIREGARTIGYGRVLKTSDE